MYKDDLYIKQMNRTYSKSFSKKQLLSQYITEVFNDMKWVKILDYGAGKDAYGTMMLREKGFNVIAYDIGDNCVEGVHDKLALTKIYDVVFASNVINVQTSHEDILNILNEIYSCMKNSRGCGYSEFYCNLPESPRKCDIDNIKLREMLSQVFGEGNKKIVSVKDNIHKCYKCTLE